MKVVLQSSECSCNHCKLMCKMSPCVGTPQDIAKLVEAGYVNKLSPTLVLDHVTNELVPILAIEGIQWEPVPGVIANACVMQDDEGFCTLHSTGLKPTEGKLMIHGHPETHAQNVRHAVLEKWKSPLGLKIVAVINSILPLPNDDRTKVQRPPAQPERTG